MSSGDKSSGSGVFMANGATYIIKQRQGALPYRISRPPADTIMAVLDISARGARTPDSERHVTQPPEAQALIWHSFAALQGFEIALDGGHI